VNTLRKGDLTIVAAAQVNADLQLRATLVAWQAEDGIDTARADTISTSRCGLAEPPLAELEVQAATTELDLLSDVCRKGEPRGKDAHLAARLLGVCCTTMERFIDADRALQHAASNGAQVRFRHHRTLPLCVGTAMCVAV
jgi:hypothetical protein